ncbi:MAG: 5'/3'-nucleotidase SurE [Planctomycetia bacterium]|nr:5'/3'-nucleotidase SurE [Planctomycetia bacterium]
MKLLLTNDDGIDAPGIAALRQAALPLGQIVVAAPADAQSGCSHRVTTNGPLRVGIGEPDRYTVHGTPADCVRLALHRLAPDFDWVLSGINAGGNLGADVHHSGTVAAVREAVLHGRPGVALSHYLKRGLTVDWQRAATWVTPILRDLLAQPWTPGVFWNINLPHRTPDEPDPEVVYCRLDRGPLPLSFRLEEEHHYYDGNYHQRRREPGADVDVCFSGKIAVTRLTLF